MPLPRGPHPLAPPATEGAAAATAGRPARTEIEAVGRGGCPGWKVTLLLERMRNVPCQRQMVAGTENAAAQGADHCSWHSHVQPAGDSDMPPPAAAAAAPCGALAARWRQQGEQPQHGRGSQQPLPHAASVFERRAPRAGRGGGAEAKRRTQAAHVASRRRRR